MNLEEIELHDAVIKSANIDYEKKMVTVELEYYPDAKSSRSRIAGKITFTGVSYCSEISDLKELTDNAAAGNISYWVPSRNGGITYLYLARGLIAITSQGVKFESAS